MLEDLILPLAESAAAALTAGALAWVFYTRFYIPVPPNRALVLFGHRASGPRPAPGRRASPADPEVRLPRIVSGGGVFVAPWNKGVGHLSLEPVDVDLTVRSMHALDGGHASGWETQIRVQAKIPTDPALLAAAAQNLLERSEEDLRAIVRRAVEGAVPAVLARWQPEPGEPDWERLASEIQASVAPDLVHLGLIVRTLLITELRRITPAEPLRPPSPSGTARTGPEPAELPGAGSRLTNLDVRLARAERGLDIMGAEVERLGRASQPVIFDIPLGFDGPEVTLGLAVTAESTHDSMGGERSPRSGRPPGGGSDGEGEREPRPLLDTEL